MDPPPPDDFDPNGLIDEVPDGGDDEGDDSDESGNHYVEGNAAKRGQKRPGRSRAPKVTKLSHENSMYQRAFEFCLSLLTPPRNAKPEEVRRHAISISFAVALIYAHIAIACGWASSIGLSGFARASTVSNVQAEVMDVRVTLYAVAIRDLHRSYCNAINYEDSLTLSNQLQEMQVKYQKTVGIPYVLPACPQRR
jgi:hypothetical protein